MSFGRGDLVRTHDGRTGRVVDQHDASVLRSFGVGLTVPVALDGEEGVFMFAEFELESQSDYLRPAPKGKP